MRNWESFLENHAQAQQSLQVAEAANQSGLHNAADETYRGLFSNDRRSLVRKIVKKLNEFDEEDADAQLVVIDTLMNKYFKEMLSSMGTFTDMIRGALNAAAPVLFARVWAGKHLGLVSGGIAAFSELMSESAPKKALCTLLYFACVAKQKLPDDEFQKMKKKLKSAMNMLFASWGGLAFKDFAIAFAYANAKVNETGFSDKTFDKFLTDLKFGAYRKLNQASQFVIAGAIDAIAPERDKNFTIF